MNVLDVVADIPSHQNCGEGKNNRLTNNAPATKSKHEWLKATRATTYPLNQSITSPLYLTTHHSSHNLRSIIPQSLLGIVKCGNRLCSVWRVSKAIELGEHWHSIEKNLWSVEWSLEYEEIGICSTSEWYLRSIFRWCCIWCIWCIWCTESNVAEQPSSYTYIPYWFLNSRTRRNNKSDLTILYVSTSIDLMSLRLWVYHHHRQARSIHRR